MNIHTRRAGPIAGLSALIALFGMALTSGGSATAAPSAESAAIPGCVRAANVEAIIDDSGSMSSEDPDKLRVALVKALAAFKLNNGIQLGAIEFGSNAGTLFGPAPIPAVKSQLGALAAIDADNGGTDYDDAFLGANAHNGSADTRLFLSDGEHNGTYDNSHRIIPTRTYVVGFGSASTSGADRLNQIALETGGFAFALGGSSQVLPLVGVLSAALNCQPPPQTVGKVFKRPGQAKGFGFKATDGTADVAVTWPGDSTAFKAVKFFQVKKGGKKSAVSASVVADAAKKKKGKKKKRRRVKAKVTRGQNFITIRLKKLKKGAKVKFQVKAKKLSSSTTVTTQVVK